VHVIELLLTPVNYGPTIRAAEILVEMLFETKYSRLVDDGLISSLFHGNSDYP
jgi:hypothetical protein